MTRADLVLVMLAVAALAAFVVIVATLLHMQANTRFDAVIVRPAVTAGGDTHRAP